MKKIRISILILVLLGSVCIVAGTVIGCSVKKDNNIIKESVYTIKDGVTAVDSLVFENVDTTVITELVISKDVEYIDFAYLNTFANLKQITVAEENVNFRSFIGSTNASILTSLKTCDMLYIPSGDHWLQPWNESEVAACYPSSEEIRIYSCGGILNVYYDYYDNDLDELYWMLKSIEYNGITKTLNKEKQITGNCSFDVFRINSGFVASHSYYSWSNAFIFKDETFIEYNPPKENAWAYGINTEGDSVFFYPDENGDLLYQRTTANMVAMQTYDWFLSLSSADQFWKEEGSVTISEDELIFIPSKTYTVADYLTQRGTTVEEEFERLTNMGVITEYESLEELFAENRSKTTP
jgi:lipoprotein